MTQKDPISREDGISLIVFVAARIHIQPSTKKSPSFLKMGLKWYCGDYLLYQVWPKYHRRFGARRPRLNFSVRAGVAYHQEEVLINTKRPSLWDGLDVMVLWRLPTLPGLTQVSSAVPGLTSLFGMGRGEHRANSHQQDFLLVYQQALWVSILNEGIIEFWMVFADANIHSFTHCIIQHWFSWYIGSRRDEGVIIVKSASCWVISTARLNVFLHIHLQPINVVVYNDPYVEDSSSG